MKPFSLPKSNLKVPIPSYNLPNKLLFSTGSDKGGFMPSAESKKSIARYGAGGMSLSNIMQFKQSPYKEDEHNG